MTVVITGFFVMMLVVGRGRQRQRVGAWMNAIIRAVVTWRRQPVTATVSVVVWSVLLIGAVGWDMASFAAQSHSLPTLSYFIGHVSRCALGRGALFALWLALGACVVVGGRTTTGPP